MFRTPLQVRHVAGEHWELTAPLIYEGSREFFLIRTGFRTDFASIPKPFRWLFDSGAYNAEAGVLHDALWRESKREHSPRVDPWDADGLFRQALRQAGASALARSSMWFAVRSAAIAHGRLGANGPALHWKLVQVGGMAALGVVLILPATVVVLLGLGAFWLASWVVAPVWALYERRRGTPVRWPWPVGRRVPPPTEPPPHELLVIIAKDSDEGRDLEATLRQHGAHAGAAPTVGEPELNETLPERPAVAPAPEPG